MHLATILSRNGLWNIQTAAKQITKGISQYEIEVFYLIRDTIRRVYGQLLGTGCKIHRISWVMSMPSFNAIRPNTIFVPPKPSLSVQTPHR